MTKEAKGRKPAIRGLAIRRLAERYVAVGIPRMVARAMAKKEVSKWKVG